MIIDISGMAYTPEILFFWMIISKAWYSIVMHDYWLSHFWGSIVYIFSDESSPAVGLIINERLTC